MVILILDAKFMLPIQVCIPDSTRRLENLTLFLEWLFEDKLIKPTDRYEYKTYEQTYEYRQSVLLIRNLTVADEGVYICRNPENLTLDITPIRLEIQFRPEILTFEKQYLAIEGDDISIDCSASGKPAPELFWRTQNRTDVSIINRFSVNRFGQMKVTKIEERDRGNYTCVASSTAGFSEKTIELNVIKKSRQE